MCGILFAMPALFFRAFLCQTLLCLLLIVSGCTPQQPEKLPVLRIGHAPHDHHAPLYIAAMNPNYFRDKGGTYLKEITFGKEYILISGESLLARVIIDSSTGGQKLVRTLDEDLNDITFGGVPAMLSFIDQGSDMQILLPVNGNGAGLVVNNDMPVASWDEFVSYLNSRTDPVRIGYKTAVSVQNLIFETALQSVSIPFAKDNGAVDGAKVVMVNLSGPKNLIPALQNSLIDGFVVNQPYAAMAEQQKAGKMIARLDELPPQGKWKNTPCCALAGKKEYVARHSEVVEPFLALLLRANRFITQNPEKSAEQIARWLGIDAGIELLSLPTIRYTTEYDADWNRGVNFWVESMIAAQKLNHKVKTAYEQQKLDQEIYDMQTFARAKKIM